ncbi:MAG TPA: hypothetical protein VMZ26_14180 [Pyrinomonadaceae bacterium]|nr:hypothetical protein [Pyrinomonadaceae bacterium]
MRRKKLTAIRTETVEQIVIRGTFGAAAHLSCGRCGTSSVWLSIADACVVSEFSLVELCRFAATGEVHSSQTTEGHLLICGQSLTEATRNSGTRTVKEVGPKCF